MTAGTVRITDARCITAAGEGVAPAMGAVGTGRPLAIEHPAFSLSGAQGEQQAPLIVRALPDEVEQRPLMLLEQLLASVADDEIRDADAVWLLCPGSQAPGGPRMDRDVLRGLIDATFPFASQVQTAESGTAAALIEIIAAMQTQDLLAVWVIAADSLLEGDTLFDLDVRVPVQRKSVDGLTPSEAAVAVRLSRGNAADERPLGEAPRIAGWSTLTEPISEAQALIQVIGQALQQADCPAQTVDRIYTDDGADADTARAWGQCSGQFWPRRPTADQHHAMELGLMEPFSPAPSTPPIMRSTHTVGIAGIAACLLQLVLARTERGWQRRWADFDLHEPADTILVCERLPAAYCSALVLT